MFLALERTSSRCLRALCRGYASRPDVTVESDFAFRKTQIFRLPIAQQDQLYYPLYDRLVTGEDKVVRVGEFVEKYRPFFEKNPDLKIVKDSQYVLNGKIASIRRAGKGSMFIDLVQDRQKVQIVANYKMMGLSNEEFAALHSNLRPGDHISSTGYAGTTKTGELSLKASEKLRLASPSLHPIPPIFKDPGKVYSHRVIDYLANQRSRDVMIVKSRLISLLRRFLENRGFMEFSTPILGSGNSGANATPFVTTSVHIKDNRDKPVPLSLRVAPELWLKKLVISGFDKVFEIGPSFRNEGVDSTHNPEFLSCEFYTTFTNLDQMMRLTEDLFKIFASELKSHDICRDRCSWLQEKLDANGGCFKKIDFLGQLPIETGLPLPEFSSEALVAYFRDLNLEVPRVQSPQNLLDELAAVYLEPLCQDCPTFLYNLPEVLSPLAKSATKQNYAVSNRFELYINGTEVINAYEEENNPFKQTEKFELQMQAKTEHQDMESIVPDSAYVDAMEWGLPPTCGWGMGIERMVMFFTNSDRIDQVLPFGKLPDVLKQ
ncbi:hypothetical protein OGAPHI_000790 [Ogataea philodendri]|uniref:Lysyl-tRNA synthetase n=1 Tax=Ogataea philodendri TaxID=1378263 RepID=A0A9P8PGL8_9ASCO|nr:uncharacterized protein OGAPHI_000790 [Ogataea philodendri]KAH3671079.1 hypothetical protein OGAPHI_000790 [Ogataea philodendri]